MKILIADDHPLMRAGIRKSDLSPGTKLTIFADATAGSGQDALDVLVYGWKE